MKHYLFYDESKSVCIQTTSVKYKKILEHRGFKCIGEFTARDIRFFTGFTSAKEYFKKENEINGQKN